MPFGNIRHVLTSFHRYFVTPKDELKEEKLKAKEEAEDLTQEMAELRYNMTCLLEEEYKRRACIEHAALQRISNLETQVHLFISSCFMFVRGRES